MSDSPSLHIYSLYCKAAGVEEKFFIGCGTSPRQALAEHRSRVAEGHDDLLAHQVMQISIIDGTEKLTDKEGNDVFVQFEGKVRENDDVRDVELYHVIRNTLIGHSLVNQKHGDFEADVLQRVHELELRSVDDIRRARDRFEREREPAAGPITPELALQRERDRIVQYLIIAYETGEKREYDEIHAMLDEVHSLTVSYEVRNSEIRKLEADITTLENMTEMRLACEARDEIRDSESRMLTRRGVRFQDVDRQPKRCIEFLGGLTPRDYLDENATRISEIESEIEEYKSLLGERLAEQSEDYLKRRDAAISASDVQSRFDAANVRSDERDVVLLAPLVAVVQDNWRIRLCHDTGDERLSRWLRVRKTSALPVPKLFRSVANQFDTFAEFKAVFEQEGNSLDAILNDDRNDGPEALTEAA